MSDLLIFDQHDNLLAILSNKAEGACPFWDAPFKEILNNGSEFQFTAPADHEDAQHIIAENQVAFMDKDGAFRLFVIKEPESTNGVDGPQITAVCEPAMLELNDEIIEDVRPYDTTAVDALTRALNGCRWIAGEVASLGNNSTNYYYISVTEAISKVINTWGGELRDRVEIEDNQIAGRYIDILPRRGADTGKLWEIDKDIISITHKVQSYPKTALYGRGASLETENGGYSRKITFADVEWSKANGDPVDKPLGQEWVGDSEALSLFGRETNGTKQHRKGIYENGEQEDPEALLMETWEALQKQKRPLENYEMDVFLLEEISGYEHEKVRLGDTSIALDRSFSKPIEIEARIIVFEYDVADPDNTGTVEMGQYIDLYADDRRLDELEAKLNEKSGIWDRGGTKPITDDRIENVPPTKVENVIATGAFKNIIVEWDFVGTIAIANYEVFASKIQGFTPDASNLVFRGKTSVYTHKADNNELWYFRVRAVNTHGLYGPFSSEAMAQTARIISDDILFGPDVAAELRELSKQAQLLAENSITEVQIADGQVTARLMAANSITAGNGALANASITRAKLQDAIIGTAQIDDLAVTNAKIGSLAVDDAKISDLSVTKLKAGTIDTSKIKIFGGTTLDYTTIDGSFLESRGRFNRSWRGSNENHDIKLRFENGYLRARNDSENRSLYFTDFGISTQVDGVNASGTLEFFSTINSPLGRGVTLTSEGVTTIEANGGAVFLVSSTTINANAAIFTPSIVTTSTNAYIGADGEVRMVNKGTADTTQPSDFIYRDVRAAIYYGTGFNTTSTNAYIGADGELRVVNKGYVDGSSGSAIYRDIRASVYRGIALDLDGTTNAVHMYVRPSATGSLRVTSRGTTDSFRPVEASEFNVTSSAFFKKNIEDYTGNALEKILATPVRSYHLNEDIDEVDPKRIGLIVQESPLEIINLQGGESINIQAKTSLLWKGEQELYALVKQVLDENRDLKQRVNYLESIA